MPSFDDVTVGTELPAQEFQLKRDNLVRYAGASGDFNIIHWNETTAKLVGLPDVIAHGMFTMASAGRLVTDWAGDDRAWLRSGNVLAAPPAVHAALIEIVAATMPGTT